MTWIRLFIRNLWFYRKPYLAVLAGVVISTAVLSGALIVGDSVRFSLHRLTDLRLGKIRYALETNERFFNQKLADSISLRLQKQVVPVLHAGGIAISSDKNLRINQVQVIGVDDRFGKFWDHPLPMPGADEVIISRNTAEKLILKQGDNLLIRIQNQGKAPSNAPFVSETMPSVSLRVKVSGIADDAGMGRFSLKNNQVAPYNIFISLEQLSSVLALYGYANMLLASEIESEGSKINLLDSVIKTCWQPADAGLNIRKLPAAGNYQITTDRIFFDEASSGAILTAIPGCEPYLTWFVNSVSFGNNSTPYSFVTAMSESRLKHVPGKGGITINDWLAKDLGAASGDTVMLKYYLMGPLRTLREDSAWFEVKSIIPVKNSLSDPSLMPDFPGMSDAGNCRDWETGAPIDLKKIRHKDELFWKEYRGTPKAFISIGSGQQIWANRFGKYTAFRFDATENDIPGIEKRLMQMINPVQAGMFFRPVYVEGQIAATNSTDFGELFLSLSFFILLSALLLTAMLFYMLAQSRRSDIATLSAIGFRRRHIFTIILAEVFMITLSGAIAGAFGGILYNKLMITGLNTIWQDAVNTSNLVMAIKMKTLLTGVATGVITAMAVLIFILWKSLRGPLSMLINPGYGNKPGKFGKTNRIFTMITGAISIGISMTIMIWMMIQGKPMNSSMSLIAGGLLIPGGLAMINLLLARISHKPADSIPGFARLIMKNLALNRGRTVSAVALLSLGIFTLIITGANRKTFHGNELNRNSGTGGFLFWAESSLPVMNNLNSAAGADIYGLRDETALRPVRYIQLSTREGDDASCLNLNQVSKPVLLGIPIVHIDRLNPFTFSNLDPSIDPMHPWKTLDISLAPDMIPGYADMTVITWGLRKSVGDTLFYWDESGGILKVKLMGGLENSIFQGNILVSDSLLRIFYPLMGGSLIMLVDGPSDQRSQIAQKLESLFQDYGLMLTPASERLASFNAVENTYLSVFMLLGGLGVILGTIGMGIVLFRNINQREQELALFAVLGFRRQFIFVLILAEHLLILTSGMALGMISALPVILPLLISSFYTVPWLYISLILLLVLANGILWIYIPARRILTGNLLSGLRTE
ncbi:MAG: ABC transporter permease [Bacteroidales bacterium]|nr:ABC transporter permease [Bacteroidales bacterium]